MGGIRLFNAPRKALTDYQNVVVIDQLGNGDYTTLSAAIAAGEFSAASATNRFACRLFGTITEPTNTSVTLPEGVDLIGEYGHRLVFSSSSYGVVAGGNSFMLGVNIATGRVSAPPTGKTLKCFVCTLPTVVIGDVGTIEAIDCVVGTVAFAAAGTLKRYGGYATGTLSNSAAGGTYIQNNSVWEASTLAALNYAITYRQYNSRVQSSNNGLVFSDSGNTIEIIGGHVRNMSASNDDVAIDMSADATGSIRIDGATIACPNSADGGSGLTGALVIDGAIGANALFNDVTFEGQSGLAVNNIGTAWSNAPFYHCRFKGGVTGVTPAAGTALGTCVSF